MKKRLIIQCRLRNLRNVQRNVQRMDLWPDGCPTLPADIESQWVKPKGKELAKLTGKLNKKFQR